MLRYGSFYDAVRVILEEGAADASWLGRYSGFYRGFQASLMLQAVELLRDRVGTQNHDLRPRKHAWMGCSSQTKRRRDAFICCTHRLAAVQLRTVLSTVMAHSCSCCSLRDVNSW